MSKLEWDRKAALQMVAGVFVVWLAASSIAIASQQAAVPGRTGVATPAIAQAAQPAPAPAEQAPAAEGSEAPQALHLLVGRSLVITSPTRIKRVSLADPNVAEAIVVSPYQVLVNGRAPGAVSLLIWDEADQSQAFEVSVDIDVLSLTEKIHEVFPSEPVRVETAKDMVVLSGKVSSQTVADKILEVVKSAAPKVTSLMEVPTAPPGEILLEVKFAEVDRTAITELGVNILSLPGAKNIGTITTQQFSPPGLQTGASSSSTTTGTSGTTVSNSLSSTFTLSSLLNVFLFRSLWTSSRRRFAGRAARTAES